MVASQKFEVSSLADALVTSGSSWSDLAVVVLVQVITSMSVPPSVSWMSPGVVVEPGTIEVANVASVCAEGRPPFRTMSVLCANTTFVPLVTGMQSVAPIRSGVVSDTRPTPRPLRSKLASALASNHSASESVPFGLAITSVITSSPGAGDTTGRIEPPSLHAPITIGEQSLSWPGVPKLFGSNSESFASHQFTWSSLSV